MALRDDFQEAVKEWTERVEDDDILFDSDPIAETSLPVVDRIIAMGRDALPLIKETIVNSQSLEPNLPWHYVVSEIVGDEYEGLVNDGDARVIRRHLKSWLDVNVS